MVFANSWQQEKNVPNTGNKIIRLTVLQSIVKDRVFTLSTPELTDFRFPMNEGQCCTQLNNLVFTQYPLSGPSTLDQTHYLDFATHRVRALIEDYNSFLIKQRKKSDEFNGETTAISSRMETLYIEQL